MEELEERLSRPTGGVVDALRQSSGDVLVLGAGGKMGVTLSRMIRRGLDEAGSDARVVAASRFGNADAEHRLRSARVDTVHCDLLDPGAVAALPDAPNVIFMAGQKFGTMAAPATTWALNVVVPAIVAQRFSKARFVVFSTGNVYPLTPISRGGSREGDALGPVGEYAYSCVGRERVFEHFATRFGAPLAVVRLNYANDLRYGVLTDIALAVWRREPIQLAMGAVNVIWQGDANAWALQCLPRATEPPFVLNVTGATTLEVRSIAERFGELLGREPVLVGEEAPDALLSNAARAEALFGPPVVSTESLIEWTASWVKHGGELLGRPTHFGERGGSF
ncbi:MAG TPA: NAD(P)-dependent oxidoreductase [Gemmatimonadaceae bacterium]|nr:NAD(P)-dependent oxidoreductase [Gemmatimonadaceae bacterium]